MAGTYRREQIMSASLDHSVWFHRREPVDQWLRYDLDAVSAASATGLAWGAIHTADGVRVATVAQEVLARPVG
jgi:acyl-CoA thioesterase-2